MSKKIKVGLIAAGAIVQKYHIPGYLSHEDVEIAAIAEPNAAIARAVAEKYNVRQVFAEYGDLLNCELDCVSICTPNKFHAPAAITALSRNIPVLCEKPLAMSMEECEEIRRAADASNAFLMVEFPMRFDKAYVEAKRLLDRGVLGKVVSVKSTWTHGGPEKWSPGGSWYYVPELAGGGAMADLAIHSVDVVRFLADSSIAEVLGFCGTLVKNSTLEDTAVLSIKFQNGILGQVDTSWCSGPQEVRTEVLGTEGRVVLSGWPTSQCEMQLEGKVNGKLYPSFDVNHGGQDPHILCVRHFVDCVRSGRPPETATLNDGIETMAAVLSVYEHNKK